MQIETNNIPFGNISELGLLVRQTRKTLNLTQTQAAGLCNVGIRFLSELERGKASLHIGKVFKVLDGFGLRLSASKRGQP